MTEEENAIILEFLPNGYPLSKKMLPIAQAIGENNLTLLELIPRKGIQEKKYTSGKEKGIKYITSQEDFTEKNLLKVPKLN